jgi:6,7-dimethyl-8-ribityllumazine synthase
MTNTQKTARIAFVKARWHSDIVDRAYEGFAAAAARLLPGATIEAFDVPGAFEMPLLAKKLAETGRYDAVAAAVVDGLMTAQMETGVPVFSVSLTPHNYQPTEVLTTFFRDHFEKKGEEAANAVRQVLDLDLHLEKLGQTKAA